MRHCCVSEVRFPFPPPRAPVDAEGDVWPLAQTHFKQDCALQEVTVWVLGSFGHLEVAAHVLLQREGAADAVVLASGGWQDRSLN